METTRRSLLVYGLLVAVWALVVVWQVEEHVRVKDAARTDLRNRSIVIANTLSTCIRGLSYRGRAITKERLQPVLDELVSGPTNGLVKGSELVSGELLSIFILNLTNNTLAFAGQPIDFTQKDILQEGEHWGHRSVTLVNPVDLGTNLVLLPPRSEMTNSAADGPRNREFPRSENRSDFSGSTNEQPSGNPDALAPAPPNFADRAERGPPPHEGGPPPREGGFRPHRPPWLRGWTDQEYQGYVEKNTLHGLVLAMSTDAIQAASIHDLWLRSMIVILATFSVVGSGLAWSTLVKSSILQIRLVRASELNTHLKEMNLAAAGLAHETRNPLNIIRGLAQMISKQPEAATEIQKKSREIVEEADKVAAQLNEFINYSRPREVRRSVLALNSVVGEVVRALNYDLEEKKIHLEIQGEPLSVEADEQLLRQALFNLLLNATQAVDGDGEIQVVVQKYDASEALLEVRDNGPGVPAERRTEIFKPYFTTQKQGTGLGLAVVQQIVLAHGWEIACLANEPRGAIFRLSHLKLAG